MPAKSADVVCQLRSYHIPLSLPVPTPMSSFWIGQERSPKEENLVMGRNGTVKITGLGGRWALAAVPEVFILVIRNVTGLTRVPTKVAFYT